MSKNETSESSGISTSNSNDSLNTTEYTSSKIAWVGIIVIIILAK